MVLGDEFHSVSHKAMDVNQRRHREAGQAKHLRQMKAWHSMSVSGCLSVPS